MNQDRSYTPAFLSILTVRSSIASINMFSRGTRRWKRWACLWPFGVFIAASA